jgi:hypothetical protein
MAELEAFKAQAEVEEQNEVLIRRFIEELNEGNTEIINQPPATSQVIGQRVAALLQILDDLLDIVDAVFRTH